jgi:hypothetical protein
MLAADKAFSLATDRRDSRLHAFFALIHKITCAIRQITGALRQIVAGVFSAHGSEKHTQTNANT